MPRRKQPYIRPSDTGVPIRRMTAQERARVTPAQTGWGTGDVWAGFGASPTDRWEGTLTNPIDVIHAPRERSVENPWSL